MATKTVINMQPVFKLLPERKIIGAGGYFISIMSPEKNNHIVIPQLWDAYLNRRNEITGRNTEADFGVITMVCSTDGKSHPAQLFYLAGAEVPDLNNIPSGMVAKIVPTGNYAVFTHYGRIDKFAETMNYIYQTWLPASGKKLRKAPELEIYDHRFNPHTDTSEMEICIPVE